ncbi:MAG: TerB family tellurite resistance protein [Rubrivivax sp.]|nr:TerB family tellurite resistance protein [Rubrivivax sp.]
MREYLVDSPQAAARIVALASVADGRLSRIEMEAARNLHVAEELGLDGPGWHEVLTSLCQDLLLSAHASWAEACKVETAMLERMLREVQNPALQRKVLQLCVAMVEADGEVSEGESLVLVTAMDEWGLTEEITGTAIA